MLTQKQKGYNREPMKPHTFSPILKSAFTLTAFTLTAVLAFTILAAGNATAQTPATKTPPAPQAERPQYPNYPSETPAQLKPATSSFDYERREVMIPMRDGVKLQR